MLTGSVQEFISKQKSILSKQSINQIKEFLAKEQNIESAKKSELSFLDLTTATGKKGAALYKANSRLAAIMTLGQTSPHGMNYINQTKTCVRIVHFTWIGFNFTTKWLTFAPRY